MEYTTNYNLKKPGDQDNVLVDDLNENMDTVDATMKKLSDGKANLDPDTGKVPDNELPDDLFLKLIGGTTDRAIAMGGSPVSGLVDPVADDHAARKGYVDAQVDTRVRIFSVPWIGTGTVGSDNPTSITFPFAPKLVFWPENWDGSYGQYRNIIAATQVTTEYAPQVWFTGSWSTGRDYIKCKRDESGKTFSWYSTAYQGTAAGQMNHSGVKYTLWAIA